MKLSAAEKGSLIETESELSVRKQCEILSYNRSNVYYAEHPHLYHSQLFRENVMARLDFWNTRQPAWGVKKLEELLHAEGLAASRDLIYELMREMHIITIYPHKNTSKADKNARKEPYLLRELRENGEIWLPNRVWSIDITYIKMGRGHMYLTAIIDWYSRYLLAWHLSDTLEAAPTIETVKSAIVMHGKPAIINSDQGSQFTSDDYKNLLSSFKIRQSMDGKGKWADNVAIERFFRNLKVENIYINEYESPQELRLGIRQYIDDYNNIRPHQSLNYLTPQTLYFGAFADCAA
jgi:putative transposase